DLPPNAAGSKPPTPPACSPAAADQPKAATSTTPCPSTATAKPPSPTSARSAPATTYAPNTKPDGNSPNPNPAPSTAPAPAATNTRCVPHRSEPLWGSDPIAQIGEPSRESPFFDQFEISAQPCRHGLLPPSDEDRHHEESDLVYQPLGQRVAGEFRSADGDVGAGVFFHLLDRGRVELALDAGLLARYIFQRSREDDLLRRSPDLGVVLGDRLEALSRLPKDHGLVHAAPVEVRAH